MRNVALSLPLFAVLLLVACGGGNASEPTPTPTATLSSKAADTATLEARLKITYGPTSTPLIAGPDVRVCRAADIEPHLNQNAATGGQLLTYIVLQNRSDDACKIDTLPSIEFRDVDGNILPITTDLSEPCTEPSSDFFCIFQQPILLAAQLPFDSAHSLRSGKAMLTLTWRTHNGAGPCPTPPPRANSVQLSLPHSDTLAVDVSSVYRGAIAPCDWRVGIFGYIPGTD